MLKNLRLAKTFFWREWRAGGWFLIFFALFFAIATLTSLHFYTDRLMQGLEQQSARLLGGDLVLSSPTPLPDTFRRIANQFHLKTAEVWLYPSMVKAKDQFQLVSVQAVSADYPLAGSSPLRPQASKVWLETRLFSLLGIRSTDSIYLGNARFEAREIPSENAIILISNWLLAPRLIMRLEDVPATQTLLPGSRVDYRLILQGSKENYNQFIQGIRPQLKPGQRLIKASNQQQTLQNFLLRTQSFLELAFIICLIMSGVAISISIRQFLQRHYSHVALWRCFGAREKQIIRVFIYQLLILALAAGIAGILAGYSIQLLIEQKLHETLQLALPGPSLYPFILGLFASILILLCFAYPVVSELPQTPPLYLWHHQLKIPGRHSLLHFIVSLGILLLFTYSLMGFSLLILFMIDILLLSIGLLYVLSLGLLAGIRLTHDLTRGAVRQGFGLLLHHPESVSVQLTALSLIVTLLLVLASVQSSLLDRFQKQLPPQTPNYFAFNLANADLAEFRNLFSNAGVPLSAVYPITRGRLVLINDQHLLSVIPESARGHNALHRELNLSWMWDFPSDNVIIEGNPWSKADYGKPLASVEASLARELGLRLNDRITFQIGDNAISATIANIRELHWTSFHPNFYVIFTPGVLDQFATTYLASFYLTSSQINLINLIVHRFPNVTIIDVAFLLTQLQDLLSKLTFAFQYLFLFAFGSAILILIASIQASMDERRKTYHLLRVLGAGKSFIYKTIFIEFFILTLLIMCISIFLSQGISYLLLRNLI